MRRLVLLLLCGCGSSTPVQPTEAGTDAGVMPDVAVSDAGGDGGQKPLCTRAAQARVAPTSLYDAFLADLATLPDGGASARTDKLMADVEAQGGTPLEDSSDRVVFLVRGAGPMGPWNVAGAFTSWSASPLPMTQVQGTDLWALDTHVTRGSAQPYKLRSGATDAGYTEDLLAHHVVWDGINHNAPGQFNAIAHAADGDPSKGRIERHHNVHATELGDDRDVFVYLPPRYDDGSCTPLPSIYFHDGNESLTRGDFAGVADATYAMTPSLSSVLVFVALSSQTVRTNEYTFGTTGALGDQYGDFLAGDLLPIVSSGYHVCSAAASRGIAGASLGGLISTYLAFKTPSSWGFVGSQSGSYFWDNSAMITRAGQDPVVPVRFYLDTGCPDGNDNCTVVKQERDALLGKGYMVQYVEDDTAMHDWPYWAQRLPKLLGDFPGSAPCQ